MEDELWDCSPIAFFFFGAVMSLFPLSSFSVLSNAMRKGRHWRGLPTPRHCIPKPSQWVYGGWGGIWVVGLGLAVPAFLVRFGGSASAIKCVLGGELAQQKKEI